jgi:hypothetical protein
MTDSDDDRKAAIARFAEHWSRSAQWHHSWRSWQPPPRSRTDTEPSATQLHSRGHTRGPAHAAPTSAPGAEPARPVDHGHLDAAARWALVAYPGAVGELISREILAHLSFGFRFDSGGLIDRLADQVLTTSLPGTSRPEPRCAPSRSVPAIEPVKGVATP